MNTKTPIAPIDSVMTVESANTYMYHLQTLRNALYQTNDSIEHVLATNLTAPEHAYVMQYSEEHHVDIEDPAKMDVLLNDLVQSITAIPVLTLEIAIEPSQSFCTDIANWLSIHGPNPVQLEIKKNPDIIAGAVISYNGKIIDHSVQTLWRRTTN